MLNDLDVIVIGGGHAGCEAAFASARMGCKTLLLTQNLDTIGHMSCNPSIGGIGKSHLVMEVDALGGLMGSNADKSGIQFRTLNRSKGSAVRAVRAQADRMLYKTYMRESLESAPNLFLFQQSVDDLLLENYRVVGVITKLGQTIRARAVVLTTGTFLDGQIHIGEKSYAGGRAGDNSAVALARRLRELKLPMGRLKTGTPPRLDGRSINYSLLEKQYSDSPLPFFSNKSNGSHPKQVPCHITTTTASTAQVIRDNLHRSPLYGGSIQGTGPRYCPSIEDKVVKFAHREQHPIFLEPEGLTTHEVYPNGISTSLPFDVQEKIIQSIPGLEQAVITRAGYAIEYDYIDPRHLQVTLETRKLKALFMAGQINGTTGYEEAAAQGLLAGANAACLAKELSPLILKREESYIGVLVDDLIHRGVTEPYRMFTSRAEYRLHLRADNADIRLAEDGRRLGLIDDKALQIINLKKNSLVENKEWLLKKQMSPSELTGDISNIKNNEKTSLERLLKRPEFTFSQLLDKAKNKGIPLPSIMMTASPFFYNVLVDLTEAEVKYAGYIARQREENIKMSLTDNVIIPEKIDYAKIAGLSNEMQQKFAHYQPKTLAEAKKISGVTPSALSLILVYAKAYAPN